LRRYVSGIPTPGVSSLAVRRSLRERLAALVAEIHDRMPLILASADYARWLGEEVAPRDLMRPH